MLEVKLRKQVVINEQGTAEITFRVEYRNNFDHPAPLGFFRFREDTSDVVDIRGKDSKDKSPPYIKFVEEDCVCIDFDLRETSLDVNETYALTVRYTIPSMVKRFDGTYFYKELETWGGDSPDRDY